MNRIILFKNKGDSILRNISILMSGTLIAQLIPVLITPILTRIYTPKDFGFYGFYLSVVGVLTVVATGRYQMALFISKRPSKSIIILKTTIFFAIFVSSLILLFVLLLRFMFIEFSFWYIFLGVVVFNAAMIETFKIYANIKKRYKLMSANMIFRSIIANMFFIILGLLNFGKDGLMIGVITGQIVQFLHFYFYFKTDFKEFKLNFKLFKATLFTYKNFLIHSSISALLNNLSIQLPTFFLKKYYSTASVGQYFQSYKLLTLPNSFVAKAFGSVFVQKASERLNNKQDVNDLVLSFYKKLVLISFIPFSVLAVYGDSIITFVLGSQWVESGKFAQIISPWVYINFIVLPFTYLFEIFQKQKHFSAFNLILLLTRLISLFVGYFYKDMFLSILLFSISSFIVYGGMLFYLFKLTKVKGIYNYIMYFVFFVLTTIVLYIFKL